MCWPASASHAGDLARLIYLRLCECPPSELAPHRNGGSRGLRNQDASRGSCTCRFAALLGLGAGFAG